MSIIAGSAVALVLHLALGWGWTLAGGVVAGWLAVRRGPLVGAVAVGLEWLGVLAYSHLVAFGPTRAMADALGGIVGNLPGAAIVALTLLIGLLLGGLGGGIGSQLARLTGRTRAAAGRA